MHHCGSSLVEAFNPTQGHSHTRSSCGHLLVTRVETGSGYPGHVLPGSSGSDPAYKVSWSDPDSALDHVR